MAYLNKFKEKGKRFSVIYKNWAKEEKESGNKPA